METLPAFQAVVHLLNDVTFLPCAVGFVVALTALLKKLLPESIGSGTIALTLQVIVWVAWVVAKDALHFEPTQFQNAVGTMTTILSAVAGFVGSGILSSVAYKKARDNNVPLLGNARSYYS